MYVNTKNEVWVEVNGWVGAEEHRKRFAYAIPYVACSKDCDARSTVNYEFLGEEERKEKIVKIFGPGPSGPSPRMPTDCARHAPLFLSEAVVST